MADFVIDDQPGATFLVELNDTLDQIAKNSLGSTAPSPTFPGMFWVDTSGANPVLRVRDGTNTTWANMGTITTSTGFLLPNTTAFTRNFLNDPDAETARTTLGVGLGSVDLISRREFVGESTVDFTQFDATTYDNYVFQLSNIRVGTTGASISMRTSTNGGSTFDTTGYLSALCATKTAAVTASTGTTTLIPVSIYGLTANEDFSGEVRLFRPDEAKYTQATVLTFGVANDGDHFSISGGGRRNSAADVDAVRFFPSTGIFGGTISMYGYRK